MSSSLRLSFHIPKALPSLSPPNLHPFSISCQRKAPTMTNRFQSSSSVYIPRNNFCMNFTLCIQQHVCSSRDTNKFEDSKSRILGLALQVGGVLATVAEPGLAVTGVNEEDDLVWILIQGGISAFIYFIVAPPIIMNWLRTRWYKRDLLEMFIQFLFVFLFFPGVLVWAPFLNFPRDPNMKYPWSVPENPQEIKGGFLKFPWAKPEDYDYDYE